MANTQALATPNTGPVVAALWDESKNTFEYNETAVNEELEIRRGSYLIGWLVD